jgi:hypothetical protein
MMNTHADQAQENKGESVANGASKKKSVGGPIFQFADNRAEALAQKKAPDAANDSSHVKQLQALRETANNSPQMTQAAQLQAMTQKRPLIQKKENNTGLSNNLKTGIENLSGIAIDDVKVHYNSDKPSQLQAHAYAQGTDIYVAPGQEKHVPHEAWHVVQQKQGRVRPTLQMKGKVNINDDAGLEKEADVMGGKALQMQEGPAIGHIMQRVVNEGAPVIQAVLQGTNYNLVAQEFRQGLIHGTYRPPTNLADMHVDQANAQNPHATAAHMLAVMQDVYQAMVANHAQTDTVGTLDWRPTGSAVVKMVGELLGGALGGSWGKLKAQVYQKKRKMGRARVGARDEMVLSKDIVPEHMAYLGALQGGGTNMKTVLPGAHRAKMQAFMETNPHATEHEIEEFQATLEAEQDQNMLEDSEAGKARLAQYRESIETGGDTMETGGNPVSLNILLKHTQLPAIIAVLESQ